MGNIGYIRFLKAIYNENINSMRKIKCLFLLMLVVLCSSCKESTEDE